MPVNLKYFLLWLPMLLLAILNGAAREFIYKGYTGELAAHQLSTISLLILFAFYIRFVVQKFPPGSVARAWMLGFFWLCLTLLFEFGFGRYRGNSWEKLLNDYDILNGRIWILIPVWVLIAPFIFSRTRN